MSWICRVITREADLVTAHEFGHNWGSEHDPDVPECSPSASHGGSYLMYTYSVSGYDVNNKKFSPCSLRFIRKVERKKYSTFHLLENYFVFRFWWPNLAVVSPNLRSPFVVICAWKATKNAMLASWVPKTVTNVVTNTAN